MPTTQAPGAAAYYAARVDAVLAQRTRLRGAQPPGDLFGTIGPDHPLMLSDGKRALDANLAAIAAYVEPDDVIVDVGGGAGRISLPLALRCREVINVDPSQGMGAGFKANAARSGIANVRVIESNWPAAEEPQGTLALGNHVTYLTRDIVPFLERMERAGPRRVVITVNSPPPPTWNRVLFELVHGEAEALVPGHAELANVLWERGAEPDIRVLSSPAVIALPPVTREAAIDAAIARFNGDQWTFWPRTAALEARLRSVIESRFDELFAHDGGGFKPRYITPGNEVLITWRPKR